MTVDSKQVSSGDAKAPARVSKSVTPLQLYDTLRELTVQVSGLADSRSVKGWHQIGSHAKDIQSLLSEFKRLIEERCLTQEVADAAIATHKCLKAIKLTFARIDKTMFRRDSKFSEPVRILIDELQMCYTKFAFSLMQARITKSATDISRLNFTVDQSQLHSTNVSQLHSYHDNHNHYRHPSEIHRNTSINITTAVPDNAVNREYPRFARNTEDLQKDLAPGQKEFLDGAAHYLGHSTAQSFSKAFELYLKGAELGYPPSMNAVASMYRDGKGTTRDYALAVQWYRSAASRGNLDAINNLGVMNEDGEGVEKNIKVAMQLYTQAANAGHLDAQTNLGYIYECGNDDDDRHPVAINTDLAISWYTNAAEKGHANAQNNLGYLYFTGAHNGTPDYEKAFRWLRLAAKQGNASSQNILGICYESGTGVEQNEDVAAAYYAEAAKQGHHSAQSSLGYLMLKQGRYQKALELLRLSAEKGDKHAFFHLGQMYHHGLYVQRNYESAFDYYLQAAERDHPHALLEVGHSYFSGRGVAQNQEKAFAFYKRCAEHDIAESENSIGIMLEEGIGTMQDIQQAVYWFQRAAIKENADALFNLGLLYESGKVDGRKDISKAFSYYHHAAELGSIQARMKLEQQSFRQTVSA